MMVGRLLSYWEANFSGAMLNFQGVTQTNHGVFCFLSWLHVWWSWGPSWWWNQSDPTKSSNQKEIPKVSLLLMVQKSGDHQLIWRIPPLFTRFYTSQMVVWDFFHPQYHSLRFSYGSLKVPLRFPFSKKQPFQFLWNWWESIRLTPRFSTLTHMSRWECDVTFTSIYPRVIPQRFSHVVFEELYGTVPLGSIFGGFAYMDGWFLR